MATKVNLDHAMLILQDKKHHKLIDVFNIICKISTQVKVTIYNEYTYKFLISSHTSSVYNLVKTVMHECSYFKSRQTVTSCINRLIELNILQYNHEYKAWEIKNMNTMLNIGFMELRKFFFSETFYNMNVSAKKIVYYASYIMSSKGFKRTKNLKINLKSSNSKWLQILNTNNIYYAKNIIETVLENYGLFIDVSVKTREKIRKNTTKSYFSLETVKKQINLLNFKFYFKPSEILYTVIGNKRNNYNEKLEKLKVQYSNFYNYIMNEINTCPEYVQSKLTDKIIVSLISITRSLTFKMQRDITYFVIKKLFHDKDISSPEKFIYSITRNYLKT